eukprot:CAMPEP_0194046854 /NCGR_PEP_ID=MMETSP0009_2-20130614/22689_1 /TAXON_ID=210454 /ORGANISM="Grammatophora oceanica, Strain CCMP 410" /LENGTH=286 /DNA_ID=CAMNT_0038692301 /DNA_START=1079 /DNA_END=1939 /DNA_ORIENTATION=-
MEKRHLDLSSSPLRGRAKVLKGAVAGAAAASVVSPGRKKDDDDEVYDSSEDDDEYDEKEFAEGPARNPNDVGVFVKGMNRVFCAYCQGLLEVWFVEVDAVDKHNAFTHPMYLNLGKESPGNTLMKRLGFRFLLRRRASTSDGDSYAKKTVVEGTGKPRVFPVHVAVRVCKKEEGSTAESRKRIGLKLVEEFNSKSNGGFTLGHSMDDFDRTMLSRRGIVKSRVSDYVMDEDCHLVICHMSNLNTGGEDSSAFYAGPKPKSPYVLRVFRKRPHRSNFLAQHGWSSFY